MLSLFYTDLNSTVKDELLLDCLPLTMQREIVRFKSHKAMRAALWGKILLLAGLNYCGCPPTVINSYGRSKNGRPFLKGIPFDFNISHSGDLVVVVFSNDKVGVDVEQIQFLDINDFDLVFNGTERKSINNNLSKLFKLWTIKEAVMKADGRGFGLHPSKIEVQGAKVSVKNSGDVWYYHHISLDPRYVLTVAADKPWIKDDLKITFIQNITPELCSKK